MSVLYRAVWSDEAAADGVGVVEDMAARVAVWALESDGPTTLAEGPTELVVSQGRRRSINYRAMSPEAFEVVVDDQAPDDATVWTTVVRVVLADGQINALVENRMESDDLTKRVSVGRPKVVHELLEAASKPKLGSSALLTAPEAIPAAGIDILMDILADPGRTIPVIVCSEPGLSHGSEWTLWARKIATRTEGAAVVVTLDGDAVTALREALGDLAVWGGGIRVYGPTPVTDGADGWRHRYYPRTRLEDATSATIDRIVFSVAQLSARRRVPTAFGLFDVQSGLPADALDGMVPGAELEALRDQWESELDLALAERSELEKELAKATGHLSRLKDELIARGMSELLWGTQHDSGTDVPDEVSDVSGAALAAQAYLAKWLAVPESAPRELEGIDTAPNSYAWGNTTWRGLRALAAYAEDRAGGWDRGGFWEWCAEGPLLGWPATSKKLSMSEGDTVQTGKYASTRVFEVDPNVEGSKSGEITMLAHLKIAEGGGSLAPRVYFYDDTGGKTKKVHVGLVGPHYLVPNKSTN